MAIFKRTWFWILIVVIAIAVFFVARNSFSRIEVKGYDVGRKELVISVAATSTGTIKADKEVRLTAQRMGRISRLFIEEGSIVAAGGVAAELEYDEVRQRLQIASATQQRMEATLSALRLSLTSSNTDIESGITRTGAVLNEAEARLKRFSELKEKGYLSQIEFDSIKREHDVAKANYDSALAARGQIRAREADIKSQEAAVRQSVAEYALAKINYEYSFIRSPIEGIITSRPVKTGDTVAPGALIASAVSTDSLYIEAFIDEADVAKVSLGQAVSISMDAYPGKNFRGEVYMISPVVLGGKQEARTFEARVRLLEKGIIVKPGMSADVEVVIDRLENVLLVPSQSIIEKNEGRYVFVVRGGRAVRTAVKTGQYNWNFTQITEGVGDGDVIIMNPDTPGLVDGARVQVAKKEK